MKIAICDWTAETSKDIELELKHIRCVGKVEQYTDLEIFRAALTAGKVYDVIFMEIDWKHGKTGVEFWEKVQPQSPHTKVIYMGSDVHPYIEEIFEKTVGLRGILIKPLKTETLRKCLERIRTEKENESGKLMIRCNRRCILIPICEIIYLESQLHKANIVLKDRAFQCNERLSDLEKHVDGRFVKSHKSYIVNMNYISEFSGSEIILNDGCRIPISKNRYVNTKEKIMQYFNALYV